MPCSTVQTENCGQRSRLLQSAAGKSVTPQAYCIKHDSVGLNTIQGQSTVVSGSLWEHEKQCASTEMSRRKLFNFAPTSLELCYHHASPASFCYSCDFSAQKPTKYSSGTTCSELLVVFRANFVSRRGVVIDSYPQRSNASLCDWTRYRHL